MFLYSLSLSLLSLTHKLHGVLGKLNILLESLMMVIYADLAELVSLVYKKLVSEKLSLSLSTVSVLLYEISVILAISLVCVCLVN